MNHIRLSHTFILTFICGCLLSQSYRTDQLLTSKELPFREVLASFEGKDHIIWMVLPTSICRNTGSDLDCFDYTLQGAESAFMVDDRYIVVHNIIKSTLGYFDTQTRLFKSLNRDGQKDLVYDYNIKPKLYFSDRQSIYLYYFKNDKYVKTAIESHFKDVFQSRRFTDGRTMTFQVSKDAVWCNGENTDIPSTQTSEYWQFIKVKDQLLINNGKTIMRWDGVKNSYQKLYEDDRICKKIYADTTGMVILNLTNPNICKYSDVLLLTDFTFQKTSNLSQFHQIQVLDSTLAHIGGYDFKHKILLSSYHGFVTLTKRPPAFNTVLGIGEKDGFGTIIKGMTNDRNGNLFFSEETNHIYKISPDRKIDTIHIEIPFRDTIIKYHFSRNIYVEPKTNLLWGVCGSYVKNQAMLFGMDLTSKRIQFTQHIPHRIWSFIPYKEKLILSSSRDVILEYDLNSHTIDTLCVLPNKSEPETRILYHFYDQLLLGGKGGLYSYNWKTKISSKLPGLDSAQVYCLSNIKNILWIGTLEGIWLYDINTKKIIRKFDKSNGLSDNYITAIDPITEDRIFVATFKGLNLIDTRKNLITPFFIKNGISDDEFNFIAHLYSTDIDYFGSINGVTLVDKSKFTYANNNIAKISKTINYAFNALPKAQYDADRITFEPDDQKVIIYLRSDSCHQNTRFAYRILCNDTSFKLLQSNSLELLRPENKDEKIEFICTNEYGIWSEKSSIINIEAKEHFYKSAWFYGLLTLFSGFVIYLISRWRINEIRNNEKAITEMNRKVSEQKLITLQSQMNPHFLFNTMSSLQYLIQTKNTTQADNLLTSFGILMRMILESSKTKYWSLREEIKMLKLYCELEKERFENDKIDINIDDDEVISSDIQIPPMIIQPFVENAFNHAFVGLDHQAILTIRFIEDAQYLKVIIQDNGIGIKKSESAKSQFHLMKKSRGLEITKERIENYNYENQRKISFKSTEANIDSLYPGTLVTIIINKRVPD